MKNEGKAGFTLLELIVVIAILMTLMLLLTPKMSGFAETATSTQCVQSRKKILEMQQILYIQDKQVKLKDILANQDYAYFINMPKCSAGGTYTVLEIRGVISEIRCSTHGADETSNIDLSPLGIQNSVTGTLEYLKSLTEKELKELTGAHYVSNDSLREFMKNKIYGGAWPELDKDVAALAGYKNDTFIQICYNNKSITGTVSDDNAIIYASSSQANAWYTNLIYNPKDQQWYHNPKNGISVNDKNWDVILAEMSTKGWKPLKDYAKP